MPLFPFVPGLIMGALFGAAIGVTITVIGSRNARKMPKDTHDASALAAIVDQIPFPLFAKDATDGFKYIAVNQAAEEAFVLKSADMIGENDYKMFPKQEADFFRKTDQKVMNGGKRVEIDAELVTTSKGTFTAHTIKVPIYDQNGRPKILLGVFHDITEKFKANELLIQAKTRAEQADQAKSEFLANMSHELRTPLNSILGMTRLLQDSGINDNQKMLAQIIYGSSMSLLEIVNDILDLSKIESGTMQLEEIGFDISYTHHSIVDRLDPLAIEKGLSPLYLEDSIPPYVIGDPARLSRVITNLISNAIKYTEHGMVKITVSHTFPDPSHIFYRCEVNDTGIGIPADVHAHIFEKFVQADASTTRRYGGTGLGLAITRQLVEMMGGAIGVESKVGEGSTFWIEIPFRVTDQIHREKSDRKILARYLALEPSEVRVLMAEDNRVNQIFMQKLMERFGITHYKIVDTGVAVVGNYQAEPWDLILMDCHMPEMNGYDATMAIRKLEQSTKKHIPIIAMTANAMVGDREECLRCGMDDYFSKPIVIEELAKLLSQWIKLDLADPKLVKTHSALPHGRA